MDNAEQSISVPRPSTAAPPAPASALNSCVLAQIAEQQRLTNLSTSRVPRVPTAGSQQRRRTSSSAQMETQQTTRHTKTLVRETSSRGRSVQTSRHEAMCQRQWREGSFMLHSGFLVRQMGQTRSAGPLFSTPSRATVDSVGSMLIHSFHESITAGVEESEQRSNVQARLNSCPAKCRCCSRIPGCALAKPASTC